MYAVTPLTVIVSEVTLNRSRSAGMPRPADGAASGFHSSGEPGTVFQFELSGPPMSVCISGLTVVGTGMVRAGT
jgi:hypothetical protein